MGKSPKILGREEILGARDLRTELVEVPEWGGAVRIRTLTAAERDSYEQALMRRRGGRLEVEMRGARVRLVALCVVDEQGQRLFSDQDIEALEGRSAAAIDRIFTAALKLNGMAEGAIEEALGNSESAP